MIANSSIKKKVESRFDIRIGNLIMLKSNSKVLKKTITIKMDNLRLFRESDISILKLTSATLSKINCKSISYFKSRDICTTNLRGHRTRTICHNNSRTIVLNKIGKSLPHCLNCGVHLRGNAQTIPATRKGVLMSNLMGISYRSINLCFALGESIEICRTTVFIMTEESLIVNKISLRRNTLIINSLPVIGRHLTFNNIDILTHSREILTIDTRSHLKILLNYRSTMNDFYITCLFRGHPLGKK